MPEPVRQAPPEPPPPTPVVTRAAPAESAPAVAAPAVAPPPPPPVAPKVVAAPTTTVPRFDAAYLTNPKPAYPAYARRRGEEGTVRLKVLVTADGRASKVELDQSSGFGALDRAALEAVQDWRFVPARRGDQAVEAWVQIPVVFRLGG